MKSEPGKPVSRLLASSAQSRKKNSKVAGVAGYASHNRSKSAKGQFFVETTTTASSAKRQQRKKTASSPLLADVLAWPSGEGTEVASLAAKPEDVFDHVSGRLRSGQKAWLFEEDGAKAVVLTGLADTPLSIVMEPEVSTEVVAVIADMAFPRDEAVAAIERLLCDRFELRPATNPLL